MTIFKIDGNTFVDEMPSGVMGYVSFHRLVTEVFRAAHEIKETERVTHISVENGGLKFRVEPING